MEYPAVTENNRIYLCLFTWEKIWDLLSSGGKNKAEKKEKGSSWKSTAHVVNNGYFWLSRLWESLVPFLYNELSFLTFLQ